MTKWLRRMLGLEGRERPKPAPRPSPDAEKKAELRAEISRFGRVVDDYRKMDVVLVKKR